MQIQKHPLLSTYVGTHREIVSFHYGAAGTGEKVYIQSSLHADELPGMLVAHHLRQRLATLEVAGRLRGEVVVVPVANPIGVGQSALLTNIGRFEVGSTLLAAQDAFQRPFHMRLQRLLALVDLGREDG